MSERRTRRQFIAGIVGLTAVASAAVMETGRTPSARVLDVRRFGAAGDARADDTEPILSALNSARRHDIVYLPAGTYRTTRTIPIQSIVQIAGAGRDRASIAFEGDGSIIRIANANGVTLRDLELKGPLDRSSPGYGINVESSNDLSILRCRIRDVQEHGVYLRIAERVTIEDTEFTNIGFSGVRLGPTGEGFVNWDIAVRRCAFRSVVTQRVDGNSAIHAHGNADTPTRNENLMIEDCFIDSHRIGIGLDDVTNANVRGCRIIGHLEFGEGITVSGPNNLIENNKINDFVAAGILLWGINWQPNDNNTVRNNEIWDCAQGVAISTWYPGAAFSRIKILGNRCYRLNGTGTSDWGDMAYGIQAYLDTHPDLGREVTDISVSRIRVVGNDLRGTRVGPYSFVEPYSSATTFLDNIV